MYNPTWGKAGELLGRKSFHAGNLPSRGASNPSPRLISNEICQGISLVNNYNLTDLVWMWGQFVDHEIDITPDGGDPLNMSTNGTEGALS